MGSIIVLSGPVGSGKTTVARALLTIAEPPLAYVEGDVFWSFIAKPGALGGRQRNFPTIMRAMFRSSAALAAGGYATLLDFSFPLWFLEPARARIENTPVHYIELRPSLATCAARAAARAEGAIADYAPYAEFYDTFAADERLVIRNDDADPADVAAEINAGLADGRFLLR